MAKRRKASPGLALGAMAAVMLLFACGTAVLAQPETADSEPVPLPTTLPVLTTSAMSAGADGAVTSTEPSVNGSRRLLAGEGARRRLASCTDQVNWCAGWKSSGYCGSQYVYNGQSVKDVVCAKTCGGAPCASSPAGGCTDQYSNCASWKSSGYCASQYTYNGKSVRDVVCAKTCGGAPCGSGGCSDKVSYCGGWKSSGYCAAGYTWNGQSVRDALCTKTCGTCGGSPGPTPGPSGGDPTAAGNLKKSEFRCIFRLNGLGNSDSTIDRHWNHFASAASGLSFSFYNRDEASVFAGNVLHESGGQLDEMVENCNGKDCTGYNRCSWEPATWAQTNYPSYPNYIGRGPMQLSHCFNYRGMTAKLGVNVEANPDVLADGSQSLGWKSAIIFWAEPGGGSYSFNWGSWVGGDRCPVAARQLDIAQVTRRINPERECSKPAGSIGDQMQKQRVAYINQVRTQCFGLPAATSNLYC
ncbi:hypothetical protein HYH03_010315 [Edaphochlamys debaryana]|uniref:ShKT domain-containing protein n=1 Tax=Edaphochlamys debaryana TaxID=47281 RepID=A0A835XWW7_9CHLO|nr:hypothetical protein HYH03_010315 [Edaphochlamys debaryana]|eukprot:KAG2491309.1 hypothetical protein HYH03_010315 [Edaphochlamys debaryana]